MSRGVQDKEKGPAAVRALSHCSVASSRPGGQAFPILNILVLHTGHEPSVAGFPFFMVMAFGSFISRLTLHFKQ